MRFLVIIALASLVPVAFADRWSPPGPRAYASPNGHYVLRVVPPPLKTEKTALAVVFELSGDGVRYEKKREFPLLNREAPVSACISDTAEVYTFDDWRWEGEKLVVVWYSAEGQKKKEFALEQLIPAKPLAAIKDRFTSVSSIEWRRGVPFINGPHVIIPDSLGGYVCLTDGSVEYYPTDEEKK